LSLAWVQFVWNHRLIFHAPKPSFLQRNLIIAPLSSPKCILSSYTMGDPNWTLEQGGSSSWQYERRFSFWVEKIELIVFRYAGFREHNIVHNLHQPRVSPFGFNRQIELGKARKGWNFLLISESELPHSVLCVFFVLCSIFNKIYFSNILCSYFYMDF